MAIEELWQKMNGDKAVTTKKWLVKAEAQGKGFSPFSLIKGRKLPREQSSTLGDEAKMSLRDGPRVLRSHLHNALPSDHDTKSRELHSHCDVECRERHSEALPLFTDKDGSKERDHEVKNETKKRQAHPDAREASCRKRTLALLYCPSSSSLESSLVSNEPNETLEHMRSIAEDDDRWGEGYRSRGSTNSSLGKGFQTEDGPSKGRSKSWSMVQYWRGGEGDRGEGTGGKIRRRSWP